MASWIQRSVGFSLLCLGLLSSGCGDERTALVVRGVSIGQFDKETGTCTFDSSRLSAGGQMYSTYLSYERMLVVSNQLTPSENRSEYRTEANIVNLREAEITVKAPDGRALSQFRVPVSGVVDPGNALQLFKVSLLDSTAIKSVLDAQVAEVSVTVKLSGSTVSSTAVTTGEGFTFPLRVIPFAAGTTTTNADGGAPVPTQGPTGPACSDA